MAIRVGRSLARFVAATLCVATAQAQAVAPIPVAVLDFDYRDTSGETRDQTREHAERLKSFVASLRADLAASGRFTLVAPPCARAPCTAATVPPAQLLQDARAAGARLLIYGEISKTSTLIQWQKVQIVDLAADRLLDAKLMSFRGDDDEAWRRAEAYLARDVLALNAP